MVCTDENYKEIKKIRSALNKAVSYTHLDVYKRQVQKSLYGIIYCVTLLILADIV